MTNVFEFFYQFFLLIWNTVVFLSDSLINGIQFLSSTLVSVPLFILELFNDLPKFVQVGVSGVFGLLLVVIILKIVALIKL